MKNHRNHVAALLLALFFTVTFSFLLLSSGTIESEDGWLFLSVARNVYYNHQLVSQPNEYGTGVNVNMNSLKQPDGSWRAPGGVGYSLAMVPAVALSDVYHRLTHTPLPTHFPLETDWSLLFFASFTNSAWMGVLAVVIAIYARFVVFRWRGSVILALAAVFLTNLAPVATFGFAHIIFTVFLVTCFLCVRGWFETKRLAWCGLFLISMTGLVIAYNFTYLLALPALVVYVLLLGGHRMLTKKVQIILGGSILALGLLLLPYARFLLAGVRIHPTVLIESLWGFLFSSGKSIFIYSPLLLIIPFFWHKLRARFHPEILSFGLLLLLYLFFVGIAHLDKGAQGIFPIWYGGAVWGPRYLVSLLPFGMLVVGMIVNEWSKKQQLLILTPLIVVSLFMQVVGVSVPYQDQYRELPYNVFVGTHELLVYDYASFIPRFSPVLIMTKEFMHKLNQFPHTLMHGRFDVHFYDGFNVPLHVPGNTYRGFLTQGHIALESFDRPHTIEMTLYNAPDRPTATQSAALTIHTNEKTDELTLASNQEQQIELQTSGEIIDLTRMGNASQSAQLIYIKGLSIDHIPVNLGSLDYPYLDLNRPTPFERYSYQYWGVKETNPWALWNMRSRLFEESFSFWWVRMSYYTDLPGTFLRLFLIFQLTGMGVSVAWLYNSIRRIDSPVHQ